MEEGFNKKIVPIGEAAQYLGVSIDTVRRWDKQGILHATRPDGKDRYFSVSELDKIRYNKPLPIGEAAERLGISETTLRRLEEQKMIAPERNAQGERLYSRETLKSFLDSDYYLRQQEVESKILDPEEEENNETTEEKSVRLATQRKVINARVEEHHQKIAHLITFRNVFYATGLTLLTFMVLSVLVITFLFLMNPYGTARWFGYRTDKTYKISEIKGERVLGASTDKAYKTSEIKDERVLGASVELPPMAEPKNTWAKILKPFSEISLGVVKSVDAATYYKIVPLVNINDVNDVLTVNNNNEITPRINFSFPDTSYLVIPDTKLINNLNADYLRGKVPGEAPGDIAVINGDNFIDGLKITEIDPIFGAWDKSTGIRINQDQITDLTIADPTETDPIFTAWDKSTGIRINQDQITDLTIPGQTEIDPIFGASPAGGIMAGDVANWNLAFGWGDHSLAGYLLVETDPIFAASPSGGIMAGDVVNWNLAFGWGNHSLAGYLLVETDPIFAASPSGGITAGDIINWNTASGSSHVALTLGTASGLSLIGQELSLGMASAGVTGALSGGDWTTFNNKQIALSFGDVTAGSTKISIGGTGTGAVIGAGLSVDVNEGNITHNNLGGLTTGDPHTQYALLVGRSGGQSLSGGTDDNDDITIQGTTSGTRTTSYVNLQPNGGLVGIGTSTPSATLDVAGLFNSTETLGADMVVDGGFAVTPQYTAATTGVSLVNNTFTLSSDPGWVAGDTVAYYNGGGTTASGMQTATSYFVKTNVAGVISVSTTNGGAAVDITGTGNNAQYFIKTNWFGGTGGTTGGVAGLSLNADSAQKQVAGVISLVPSVALAPSRGSVYKIQFTVSNYSATSMTVGFGGVTTAAMVTANGTYTQYVTATTTGSLIFTYVTGARFDIDDVSVRPVTSGITATTGTPLVFNQTLSDGLSNQVAYSMNYTANKATTGNDTGLVVNQTDVTSPGTSLLLDLQAGGVSKFRVDNAGAVTAASGITAVSLTSTSGINVGGALSGASTGAFSGAITSTVPTAGFISADANILQGLSSGSTGTTLALLPIVNSPRLKFLARGWDINGAVDVPQQYIQEAIAYPGDTVNSKLSWRFFNGTSGTAAEYQAPEIMNYYNNALNVLGNTYGAESLTNPGLTAPGAEWATGGFGWTLSGGVATYLRSASGSGTLTQPNASLVPGNVKPNRWYRFTYATSAQNQTVNAYIDPAGISQERVYLPNVNVLTAGTWTVTFKTNANAATRDFVLTAYGTAASDACTFDNFSLVEVQSGDVVANGLFTGGGTSGVKIDNAGNVGIGVTDPTAVLNLKAGTTAASSAPLKFTSGTNMTIAEAGAIEFTTDDLYFTITTGAARKGFVFNDGTNLTATRVPFATTNGRLTDAAGLVWDGTYLQTKYKSSDGTIGGSTSVTVKGSDGLDCTMTFKDGLYTATTCP